MRISRFLLSIALLLQIGLALAETAATVVFATGTPTVVGANGVSRALVRGGEVAAGETVDTADGRVQLRFRDGASMSLQPATRFRVDDYRYKGEGGQADADDKSLFSLLKGGLRTITGLIGKNKRENYRVDTVVATIGIRGTEYGANLAEDGLRVTTFAGLVEVCNRGGCQLVRPGETALADHPEHKPRLLSGGSTLPRNADVVPQLPTAASQQELPAGGHMPQASPATAPSASPPVSPAGATYPSATGYSPSTGYTAPTNANSPTSSGFVPPR